MDEALKTAVANPEMQTGAYGLSPFFLILISKMEKRFPGSAAIAQKAADSVPWSVIGEAMILAFTEYQAGKDFLTIFKEVLATFGVTGL